MFLTGGKKKEQENGKTNDTEQSPSASLFTSLSHISRYHWLTLTLAALSGILDGGDLGAMTICLPAIQSSFGLCGGELSCWNKAAVVALTGAGAVVGSLIGGLLSDFVGRKAVLVGSDVLCCIGASLGAWSVAVWQLHLGRLLVGIGVGSLVV
eukprot:Cvel_16472.t1-p1 / transcript=Cvel_16472.t1 / gene=Cvel_16472 / organism=Chromera_velia_CCMP2878 / gene_product=hypothetical protein / transcript_product=hypothetical protein / location=Cvel_scaffold1270:515-2222(-) / protein_length=152 / sequence_SO=supercontig / SO=protein_coding / is_pseudo=false